MPSTPSSLRSPRFYLLFRRSKTSRAWRIRQRIPGINWDLDSQGLVRTTPSRTAASPWSEDGWVQHQSHQEGSHSELILIFCLLLFESLSSFLIAFRKNVKSPNYYTHSCCLCKYCIAYNKNHVEINNYFLIWKSYMDIILLSTSYLQGVILGYCIVGMPRRPPPPLLLRSPKWSLTRCRQSSTSLWIVCRAPNRACLVYRYGK